MAIVRYVILALSAAAVVMGVLVTLGVLELRNLTGELRVLMGVVLTLYGVYRFVAEYVKKSSS
jgi:hypothetical protein